MIFFFLQEEISHLSIQMKYAQHKSSVTWPPECSNSIGPIRNFHLCEVQWSWIYSILIWSWYHLLLMFGPIFTGQSVFNDLFSTSHCTIISLGSVLCLTTFVLKVLLLPCTVVLCPSQYSWPLRSWKVNGPKSYFQQPY